MAEWEMDEAHGLALEARGLSVETAVKLGWRPCAGPGDVLWLAIPIIDHGVRVGTKRRTIGGDEKKRFTQDKGTPQILYNVDCLRDPELAGHPLMITEGECDALAAIQCGYPKTVSVPGGAPELDDGEDGARWAYLAHAKAELAAQKVIVLAVDADRNGQVLQEGLARRLGRSRCQVLSYPSGKDLNDVLAAHGPQALRRTVGAAQYMPMPGLMRLGEIPTPPLRRALDTMIPGLEPHMRIRRGDLIVITGPPGHGKSTFVNHLVCNMAWHWKAVSAIASMEQAIVPDLRRVFRSFRIECLEREMAEEQKRLADEWIDRHFVFLQPGEDDMTLAWMLERFAAARQRHNAGIAVIDPWNEVSIADKPVDLTTEQWISQSLREIKRFARTHDIAVIIVAHPRKLGRDKNGKVPRPTLWDIADSASWANRCDLGVVVYRPELLGGGPTEISVEKSRDFYALGTPGTVTLQWNPEQSRFGRLDYP
jgi:twinkle protein